MSKNHHKKYVLAVWDTSERIDNKFAESFCKNLLEFWSIESSLKTLIDNDPDALLRKASQTKSDWVIFCSLGADFYRMRNFFDALDEFIESEPPFVLMGHILDRKEKWYELHDQCFVLNLSVYRDLGGPSIGYGRDHIVNTKPVVLRSSENFHDDYTPHWIQPTKDTREYQGQSFGHQLLEELIRAGYGVRAFPDQLREAKNHFYPTVRGEFARKYWQWEQKEFLSDFFGLHEKMEVPMASLDFGPIKEIYSTIGGLPFFRWVGRLPLDENLMVRFLSDQQEDLLVMRKLVYEWDGRDYFSFLRNQFLLERVKDWDLVRVQWEKFVQQVGGESKWLEIFSRFQKSCQFSFHEMNVFSERPWSMTPWPDQFPEQTFFLFGRSFHSHARSAERSLKERREIQRNFIYGLKEACPNSWIYMTFFSDIASTYESEILKVSEFPQDEPGDESLFVSGQGQYPWRIKSFFQKNMMKRSRALDLPRSFYPYIEKSSAQMKDVELHEFCEWIEKKSLLPWLKLELPIPHQEMLKEAQASMEQFVDHRKDPNYRWKSVCIHGADADKTEDYYQYGYESKEAAKYQWTHLAESCPVTVDWLKNHWPMEKFDRVRFMLLEPGGMISPHNDTDGRRGFHATNVALNQPERCHMVMENHGIVPWSPGDIRRLDIGLNHSVYNGSYENRYHMIIHGQVGARYKDWQRMIVDSFLKHLRSGSLHN